MFILMFVLYNSVSKISSDNSFRRAKRGLFTAKAAFLKFSTYLMFINRSGSIMHEPKLEFPISLQRVPITFLRLSLSPSLRALATKSTNPEKHDCLENSMTSYTEDTIKPCSMYHFNSGENSSSFFCSKTTH